LVSKKKVALPNNTIEEFNNLIVDAIQDIKGKELIKLDLRHIDDAPTDFFIICQGESTTQVRAISQNIEKRVKEEMNTKPYHVEGILGSKWVLVDYFTTVVHVFYPETREFYNLEDLWIDAVVTRYENV
jgi:ribosome-associated protein